MIKRLKCKKLKKVHGGYILKCIFPISGTLKDPLLLRNIVTCKGGYAIYDDKDNYVKGFSTGNFENDRYNAITWAQKHGISTEERHFSYFLSNLK